MESTASVGQSVLDWLRAGYPEGVPPQDYLPVLGVLQRRLTSAEISSIADDLVQQFIGSAQPIARADIEAMIRQTALQPAGAGDVARVCSRLAAGGWPLADPHAG